MNIVYLYDIEQPLQPKKILYQHIPTCFIPLTLQQFAKLLRPQFKEGTFYP